jgi:hypothetical protein
MGNVRQHTQRKHTGKTLRLFLHHAPRVCVAFIRITIVIWSLFALGTPAYAANCVWMGKGDSNRWSSKGNWATCDNGVPKNNDSVDFPAGALQPANENDISPLSLANLTINGTGDGNTRYEISGLGVTVTGVVRVLTPPDAAGRGPSIRANIVMAGKGIIVGADTVLSIVGALTGQDIKAIIPKGGAGTLVLFNPANNWAVFEVNEGTLRLGAAGVMPDKTQL